MAAQQQEQQKAQKDGLRLEASWFWNERTQRLELVSVLETDETAAAPIDIAFAIDDSGSMGSVKPLVWEVVDYIVENLSPDDGVSAFAFDGSVRSLFSDSSDRQPPSTHSFSSRQQYRGSSVAAPWPLPDAQSSHHWRLAADPDVKRVVENEKKRGAGGSTNISDAIRTAADALCHRASTSQEEEGNRRRRDAVMVVLTDGQPNGGIVGTEALAEFVRQQVDAVSRARDGADVCVVVFGLGVVNHTTLEALAVSSDGDYTLVEKAEDAAEMAGDVIVKTKNRPFRRVTMRVEPEEEEPERGEEREEEEASPRKQHVRWQFEVGTWLEFPDAVQQGVDGAELAAGGFEYVAPNGHSYRVLPGSQLQHRVDNLKLVRPVRRNADTKRWEWQSSTTGSWADYVDPETIARLESAWRSLETKEEEGEAPPSHGAMVPNVRRPGVHLDRGDRVHVEMEKKQPDGASAVVDIECVETHRMPSGASRRRAVRRVLSDSPLRTLAGAGVPTAPAPSVGFPHQPPIAFGVASDAASSGEEEQGEKEKAVVVSFEIGARLFSGVPAARVVSIDPASAVGAPGTMWSVRANGRRAAGPDAGALVEAEPEIWLKVPSDLTELRVACRMMLNKSPQRLEVALHSLLADVGFACFRFSQAQKRGHTPPPVSPAVQARALDELNSVLSSLRGAPIELSGRAEIVDSLAKVENILHMARTGRASEACAAARTSSETLNARYRYGDTYVQQTTQCATRVADRASGR